MLSNLLGNPHSTSGSSQLSSQHIEDVRFRVLNLYQADPDQFDLVFVSNATAGAKLVAEGFRGHKDGFWYGYHRESHTSLVGMREEAYDSRCFESDHEVESWLNEHQLEARIGLFAYPAQSNMNGRRLPLDWLARLRKCGNRSVYSLLDAAAYVSTAALDFSDASQAPDFTILSFYKIFGFPDLGALIIRKDSDHIFRKRKYFGGGTVELVSCSADLGHIRKDGSLHEQLEDGTLPIHNIMALGCALTAHEQLFESFEQISKHTSSLACATSQLLRSLQHGNGLPVCRVYEREPSSYGDGLKQGPVIAFNLLDCQGAWISNYEIMKLASVKSIHIRAGTLCNPGGVASYLGLSSSELKAHYNAGFRCGNEKDILDGKPMGVLRISFGAMSNFTDVTTFMNFIKEYFVEDITGGLPGRATSEAGTFVIDSLCVYPIKSCGGMEIPAQTDWPLRPEGLAWDREWCLIHQGTRVALSQKKHPRMALFKPSIDFATSELRVSFTGPRASNVPSDIAIPLVLDPSCFLLSEGNDGISSPCSTQLCGDKIRPIIYKSASITFFFTAHLGVPCQLARFPSSSSSLTKRLTKTMHRHQVPGPSAGVCPGIPGSFPSPPPSPPPRPILLSNASPILIISRSSVNALKDGIDSGPGKALSCESFRANIILAQRSLSKDTETPWVEDTWRGIRIAPHPSEGMREVRNVVSLEILGQCRRCQMVCIDQKTGERGQEPFLRLSKVRRWNGGVWFGVHAGLMDESAGSVKAGDIVTAW